MTIHVPALSEHNKVAQQWLQVPKALDLRARAAEVNPEDSCSCWSAS